MKFAIVIAAELLWPSACFLFFHQSPPIRYQSIDDAKVLAEIATLPHCREMVVNGERHVLPLVTGRCWFMVNEMYDKKLTEGLHGKRARSN